LTDIMLVLLVMLIIAVPIQIKAVKLHMPRNVPTADILELARRNRGLPVRLHPQIRRPR